METPDRTLHYKDLRDTHTRRVSWQAIFAGTIVMLVVMMLLSLLGIGIGLASYNPMEEIRPMQGIGTGALIWWVISNLLAVFAGGYVAAHMTTLTYKSSGIYHGILSWALYTLISFWLLTTAVGAVISGVGTVVTGGLSAMGQGVSQLAGMNGDQLDNERLNQMIQDALTQDERRAQQEFDIDVMAVIQDVFFVNGEFQDDVQRQDVQQAVARHSTLSQQDVQRATDVIMREYQRLEQQWRRFQQRAEEVAQRSSDAAGRAAIWGFVALLLGAVAAAFGGNLGRPEPYEVQEKSVY